MFKAVCNLGLEGIVSKRLTCGYRSGQYRKQKLIERYGAHMRLPDLRQEIAQCERRGQNARRLHGSLR